LTNFRKTRNQNTIPPAAGKVLRNAKHVVKRKAQTTQNTQDGRTSSQGWYFETSLEHQTVGWVYRYYTGNVTRNFPGVGGSNESKKIKIWWGLSGKDTKKLFFVFSRGVYRHEQTYTRDKKPMLFSGNKKSKNS